MRATAVFVLASLLERTGQPGEASATYLRFVGLPGARTAMRRAASRRIEALQADVVEPPAEEDIPRFVDGRVVMRDAAGACIGCVSAPTNVHVDTRDQIGIHLEAPGAPEEQGTSVSPIGPIVLGVGGLATLTGLVLSALGYFEFQALAADCPAQIGCDPTVVDEAESHRHLAIGGDLTWMSGAVLAGLGLVLTLTLDEDRPDGRAATAALSYGAP